MLLLIGLMSPLKSRTVVNALWVMPALPNFGNRRDICGVDPSPSVGQVQVRDDVQVLVDR